MTTRSRIAMIILIALVPAGTLAGTIDTNKSGSGKSGQESGTAASSAGSATSPRTANGGAANVGAAKSSPKSSPQPSPPVGTSAVVMDLSAVDGVIGRGVRSSLGEDMGQIVDLLVTPAGQVRAAVIDFGGVLGVGSRKVAVDWKALGFANIGKGGPVDLSLTRNEVRVAPEYRSGDPIVILEASKVTKTTPSDITTVGKSSEKAAPSPVRPHMGADPASSGK